MKAKRSKLVLVRKTSKSQVDSCTDKEPVRYLNREFYGTGTIFESAVEAQDRHVEVKYGCWLFVDCWSKVTYR